MRNVAYLCPSQVWILCQQRAPPTFLVARLAPSCLSFCTRHQYRRDREHRPWEGSLQTAAETDTEE